MPSKTDAAVDALLDERAVALRTISELRETVRLTAVHYRATGGPAEMIELLDRIAAS